jgi:hypothetical protein
VKIPETRARKPRKPSTRKKPPRDDGDGGPPRGGSTVPKVPLVKV